MSTRFKWKPMDYILLILTLTAAISLVMMIAVPLYFDRVITTDREMLIKTSLAGIFTVIVTWFGAKIQGQRDKED